MARSVTYSDKCYLVWENELSQFRLTRSFKVLWLDGDETLADFTVRRDFLTDLSSIPRIARSFIPQIGHHLQPAVTHDWVYDYDEGLTRLEGDQMMLDGMRSPMIIGLTTTPKGVSWVRRRAIYRGVRLGGWTAWGAEEGDQVFG